MKERDTHSKIPKREALDNYKVPAHYFEQNALQLKQIAQDVKQDTPQPKVFQLKPLVTWLSAAAVVTLIVFGVVNRKQTQIGGDAYLTQQDVYLLVEEGEVVFDDYELAYSLEIENIDWALADDLPTTQEQEELPYYLEEYLLNY